MGWKVLIGTTEDRLFFGGGGVGGVIGGDILYNIFNGSVEPQ